MTFCSTEKSPERTSYRTSAVGPGALRGNTGSAPNTSTVQRVTAGTEWSGRRHRPGELEVTRRVHKVTGHSPQHSTPNEGTRLLASSPEEPQLTSHQGGQRASRLTWLNASTQVLDGSTGWLAAAVRISLDSQLVATKLGKLRQNGAEPSVNPGSDQGSAAAVMGLQSVLVAPLIIWI